MMDKLFIKKWKCAGGQVAGLGHEKFNIPGQDRVAIRENGLIKSIALADGAGSRKKSQIGAEYITNSICDISSVKFNTFYSYSKKRIARRYKNIILNSLKDASKIHSLKIDELSSTLLFVVTDGIKYIAGHIGDGIIATIEKGKIVMLSEPENQEFANVTYFTTSPNIEKHLRIYRGYLKSKTGFILMSDGAADGLFLKATNTFSNVILQINDWLKEYSSDVVSKAIVSNLNSTIRRKTQDDCSLIIISEVKENINLLSKKNISYLRDCLNMTRRDAILKRVKIIKYLLNNESKKGNITSEFGLTKKTVAKHIKEIKNTIITGDN